MDAYMLVATLLHDVIEDAEEDEGEKPVVDTIESLFGKDVLNLIEGVSHVGKISGEVSHEETLQKIFEYSSQDARILIIKIADRVHNIATLGTKKGEEKRTKKVKETLDIYVSAAEKLQLKTFSLLLSDGCSYALFPEECRSIENVIEQKKEEMNLLYNEISNKIIVLENRSKGLNEIRTPSFSLEICLYSVSEILSRGRFLVSALLLSDLFYINVLTNSKESCYYALSLLGKEGRDNTENFVGILRNDVLAEKKCIHNPLVGKKYIPEHARALDAVIYLFPERFIYIDKIFKEGKELSLHDSLSDNDILECVFLDEEQVHPDWIKFVVSSFGKVKIQNVLKKKENFEKYTIGKKFLQSAFNQFKEGEISGILKKHPEILASFNVKRRDELYVFVAEGMIEPREVLLQYEKIKNNKVMLHKITSFFSHLFSSKQNKMKVRVSSHSHQNKNILEIITQYAKENSVEIQKIICEKNSVFAAFSSEDRISLLSLFSQIKANKKVLRVSFLPPLSFYLKILGIFMIPVIANFIILYSFFRKDVSDLSENIVSIGLILMFNISILITFIIEAFILQEVVVTYFLVIGGVFVIASSAIAEYINTKCEKKEVIS